MVKQCNNCKKWRLGTASLDDNYCNLTGEWTDYEGYCDNWESYLKKQFELVYEDYDGFSIRDNNRIEENKHYNTLKEVVELLNQLSENGRRLNKLHKEDSRKLNELHKENQRLESLLKSERRGLIEQNNNYQKHLTKLEKENLYLKETKEILIKACKENNILFTTHFI